MKSFKILFSILNLFFVLKLQAQDDQEMIRKIYDEALLKGESYEMLDYLSNRIGGRLSGSPEAAAAVEWGRQVMKEYGFDTVYLQPVMVPHWVRGQKEFATIVNSKRIGSREVNVCSLGNAVGTGEDGVQGQIIEVKHFDELRALGREKVAGKIVFFNRPMDATEINTFTAYSKAVPQRSSGPSEAAKLGAIGAVVRSMTTALDDFPHTGSLRYQLNIPKIPAVAISTNDAELLSKLLRNDENLEFYFETHCQTYEDKLSYNVVGELWGSEKPDEYIVVGGHLDSWDLGDGAHDDGAGSVQAIEAVRLLKALNYKPKHTLRAVLFMNEENGLRGGRKYAAFAKDNNEKHIAGIESDAGGFTPRGFSIDGKAKAVKKAQKWSSYFKDYNIHLFEPGYGGADISPLKDQDVPLFGLRPDSQRYFLFHHTSQDTFEFVDKRELELGAATMSSLLYLIDKNGL